MICAIVLAAGRSERMGTQKLLLPIGGKPVIARIVSELMHGPIQRALVVTGRDGEAIKEVLAGVAVNFVGNPECAGDMLSSIRCGLRALPAECTAFLIVLGDQPNLTAKLVAELIGAHSAAHRGIIVPTHNGHRGHPVLLAARFRDELLAHHDGAGMRGLLEAHSSEIQRVEISDAATLADMDTPEDYLRHKRRASA